MKWTYNDGGRSKYFKKADVRDCVCRAVAIGSGMDYMDVYRLINKLAQTEVMEKKQRHRSSARDGVYKQTTRALLSALGWEWHPVMGFGTGCRMHMKKSELPSGTIIVKLSRHLACVKNGVLHDTFDCSRGGTRCVYGYWTKPRRANA